MTSSFVLALRFLFAPRGLPKLGTNGPPQREAERRKARGWIPRSRTSGAPLALRFRGARSFGETRSPSGALPRLSPETFRSKAQSGPALHGSANGYDSVRHPGSQLLADRRRGRGRGRGRGRPGGFPNRPNAVCETASRHRARSTLQIASGKRPSANERCLCTKLATIVKICR